jgi:hypothetical protein
MRSVPPYTVGKILKRLPATHVRGIGQVVVAHSRLYWVTRQLVADLLRVDQGACRLAVKPVKTSDMFLIAKDLLEMWGPTIKIAVPLGNLHKKIKKCDDERNALAHGVWRHYGKGDIRLLRVKGASPPPWEDLKWLFLPKATNCSPTILRFGLRRPRMLWRKSKR